MINGLKDILLAQMDMQENDKGGNMSECKYAIWVEEQNCFICTDITAMMGEECTTCCHHTELKKRRQDNEKGIRYDD